MEKNGIRPIPGEFYRHFKGKLYQVKMLAKDSEDGNEMVVYQAMYPPFTCYVRSLAEFISRVDEMKYPDAEQKMRFMRVNIGNTNQAENREKETVSEKAPVISSLPELTEEELEKILCNGNIEKYIGSRISEADLKRRGFLMFLDAESVRKKRQIFTGLSGYFDQVMLNNIAVTLDLVLEEEDEDAQYDAILKCLGAMEHYEGGRLR